MGPELEYDDEYEYVDVDSSTDFDDEYEYDSSDPYDIEYDR